MSATVFVAGATGVLGHRLVDRLTDQGYDVVGLARDDAGERLVERLGGTARRGDVLDPATLDRTIDDDVAVLIHAATAIPDSQKPSDEEWARNDRVRREGMRNLLDAAGELRQVVFPSVVWVARQPDGSRFDETADRHPDRATQSAADVEDLLDARASDEGFDAAVLRCGFFYAPDARDTREWGEQLLDGDLPVVGGGLLGRRDAELSFVHADDAANAFVAAVEREASGVFHVVDDEPATAAAFFGTFADLLDAPEPSRIPGWLARFFVGEITAKGLTRPTPTTNERARRDLGWEPEYPTYRGGLRQVVETWDADGTLAELRGESRGATASRARGASARSG
ncbi:NAD-dependent epimerase/dehydratase family protein [Salinigranum salinum]|uniref:NAD-dependent epimerase/dehydratase family protein n=1 Tax=Salinigranum salinum TaxID=1364937 RepID=UPI0012611C15|nr:NAD(P)-dependent oxidoreductase [Salinigranum salinum]